MKRKVASAEEIQKEIAKRINLQQGHLEEYAKLKVQLPEWKEPDQAGCNWDVAFVGIPRGSIEAAYQAASEVKRLYALQT